MADTTRDSKHFLNSLRICLVHIFTSLTDTCVQMSGVIWLDISWW